MNFINTWACGGTDFQGIQESSIPSPTESMCGGELTFELGSDANTATFAAATQLPGGLAVRIANIRRKRDWMECTEEFKAHPLWRWTYLRMAECQLEEEVKTIHFQRRQEAEAREKSRRLREEANALRSHNLKRSAPAAETKTASVKQPRVDYIYF